MQEFIEIKYVNSSIRIDGRELHKVFKIKDPYLVWIMPLIYNYGFVKNKDYWEYVHVSTCANESENGHFISVDMAKQLCMLQGKENGKKVRLYLDKVETEWNAPEKRILRDVENLRDLVIKLKNEIRDLNVAFKLGVDFLKDK